MNTLMEHFNSILFHKSGPANKEHTYQSVNQFVHIDFGLHNILVIHLLTTQRINCLASFQQKLFGTMRTIFYDWRSR